MSPYGRASTLRGSWSRRPRRTVWGSRRQAGTRASRFGLVVGLFLWSTPLVRKRGHEVPSLAETRTEPVKNRQSNAFTPRPPTKRASTGGKSPRSARTYTQPSRHRYNARRRIAMTIVHCCCRRCLLAGCLRIVIVAFIGGRVWRCAATPPRQARFDCLAVRRSSRIMLLQWFLLF